MHHVPSPTFGKVIDSSYARYKIGLSGTIERKDGKHVVFPDYFGKKLYQPPKENYMVPSVDIIRTDIRFPDGARTPWALRVNELVNTPKYIELIAILASAYAAKGHKVLVVSDRTQFIKNCAKLVGDNAVYVIGEVPFDEREVLNNKILSGDKDVLFGTQSIYGEGISINPLSCLILATPVNNDPLLTQLIGRVCRQYPGKLPPKIVDIHLIGNTARRQASNRVGYYMKQGYHIREL